MRCLNWRIRHLDVREVVLLDGVESKRVWISQHVSFSEGSLDTHQRAPQARSGSRTDSNGEGEKRYARDYVFYQVWLPRSDEGSGLPVVLVVVGGSLETVRG